MNLSSDKKKKWFWERLFEVNESCSSWKNYGKCEARTHQNIKIVTTKRRKNNLELESNYQTTHFFADNILAIELKKNWNVMKSLFIFVY